MKLYSYIVSHDTGFAPNPFFGYCTLACCKPPIRERAEVGDWIVGLEPKKTGHRIVYFMRVDDKIPFDRYWSDPRFRNKRPRPDDEVVRKCGDNIYESLPGGEYRQLRSVHSKECTEDPKKKAHDLKSKYVLISTTFSYFGSKTLPLPKQLAALVVQPGCRSRFSAEVIAAFLRYARRPKPGVHARPRCWPPGDRSWEAPSIPQTLEREDHP